MNVTGTDKQWIKLFYLFLVVVIFALILFPIAHAQEPSESECPCDFDLAMVQEIVLSMDGYKVECQNTYIHTYTEAEKSRIRVFARSGSDNAFKQGPVIAWTTDYDQQLCSEAIIDGIDAITSSVIELTMDQLDACSDLIQIACDSFLY